MQRRTFLVTASALAAGSVAGCASRAADRDGGDSGRTDTTTDGDGHGNGDDGTQDPTGTTTDDGGDGDGGDGGDCPSFVDGVDRTVCYQSRGDAEVFLRPSTLDFQDHEDNGEVETLTLTLHNEAEEPFVLNPYEWAVKRRTGDGWEHLAPDAYPEPLTEVDPGGTFEWVLSTEPNPSPADPDTKQVVVEGLTSGDTHAFVVHGTIGRDGSTRVELVALFDYVRSVPGV